MEILKFTLKGKNAFFKMPEVNTYFYFTYGNIHKVALMGIFGAILGYKGYGQLTKDDKYPEFYERLKDIQISIVPKKGSKGYILKKIQNFNNSVGYASQEQGGNLIVSQQWLENPWWEIYVKIDSTEAEAIRDAILKKTCVYMPYLGSNDHPADICDAEVVAGELIKDQEITRLDSLFPCREVELDYEDDEITAYKYVEYLPVALKEQTHMYCLEKFYATNIPVLRHDCDVYRGDGKNIVFY